MSWPVPIDAVQKLDRLIDRFGHFDYAVETCQVEHAPYWSSYGGDGYRPVEFPYPPDGSNEGAHPARVDEGYLGHVEDHPFPWAYFANRLPKGRDRDGLEFADRAQNGVPFESALPFDVESCDQDPRCENGWCLDAARGKVPAAH